MERKLFENASRVRTRGRALLLKPQLTTTMSCNLNYFPRPFLAFFFLGGEKGGGGARICVACSYVQGEGGDECEEHQRTQPTLKRKGERPARTTTTYTLWLDRAQRFFSA